MLLLAAWVLPAPLREAAADERFALEVLRLEAAELRLAEEDPAALLREELATLLREELAALLREELADERLAEEDPAALLREELADERLALEAELLLAARLLPAPLREAAADERLELDEERSELADDRLVVPRPFLVTVFFLS